VGQTVSSLVTCALLALFPIAGAARASRFWHRTGDSSEVKTKWLHSEWFTAIAATAIVCLLMVDIPLHTEVKKFATPMTALILFNFLIGVTCLFSWGYLLRRKAWIFAVIWVILTWLVPVIVDGVYRGMTDNNDGATLITAISPAGTLALIWSDSSVSVYPGIAVQTMLTSIPAGLLLMTHMRRRRVSGFPVGRSRAVPARGSER
jgi:hypothetical protein